MDQFFFTTPFAALGDQTSFPIATDPGGSVTFQQGWGPDYALDQDTDSNAKPIDRASTNYLMYVITNALAALQRVGIPEWITPANNNGVALPYPKYAQVRYSATSPGVTFATYVSVVDNNTSVPGADNNWQPILSIAAQAADVNSGSPSSSLTVTPAALQAYAGNSAQTFNVATALNPTHAVPLQQAQNMRGSLAGESNQNATGSLTTSILGDLVRWIGAAGTLTLPAVSTVTATGIAFPCTRFKNDGTGVLTVAANGGDSFTVPNGTVTSITLQPGDDLIIMWSGIANTMRTIGGLALAQFAGRLTGIVGQARRISGAGVAASTTGNWTAQQIIVATAQGGSTYLVQNAVVSCNLATVGLNGMAGGAAPANGFVAIYLLYNPTTGAVGTYAINATGAVHSDVYDGVPALPAGFTASALLCIAATNASGQFTGFQQVDRIMQFTQIVVGTFTANQTQSTLSLASVIPPNARAAYCNITASLVVSSGAGSLTALLTSNASPNWGVGTEIGVNAAAPGNSAQSSTVRNVIATPQTTYLTISSTGAASQSVQMGCSGFEF